MRKTFRTTVTDSAKISLTVAWVPIIRMVLQNLASSPPATRLGLYSYMLKENGQAPYILFFGPLPSKLQWRNTTELS